MKGEAAPRTFLCFFLFTALRYALARSLLSPGVCLSVGPSVTLVHSTQTAEDIVKLLYWAVAPSF